MKSKRLEAAIAERSLTGLTKALGELANQLGYQLKLPYTEILNFKAIEQGDRFTIRFSAKLHLHYSSFEHRDEGLIFVVKFGGEALAESPEPPIHELFYAAIVDSLSVYGYGSRWHGEILRTPAEYGKNLDITAEYLNQIQLARLYQLLQ